MQFNKNTSLGGSNIVGLIIKSIFGLAVILGLVFSVSLIDLPAPKKDIKKISPRITERPILDFMIKLMTLVLPELVFLSNCI